MDEAESRRIAGLLGLSGVLMFVAGLAIVRAHNRWCADWTVLVTLSGWLALALGSVRMFAASAYQQKAATIGGSVDRRRHAAVQIDERLPAALFSGSSCSADHR
jgi:hypothetical protein